MREWSIRGARDHLSELVEAARQAPQSITRRGRPAVVVMSIEDYDRLHRRDGTLSRFFAGAGLEDVAIERVEAAVRDDGEL